MAKVRYEAHMYEAEVIAICTNCTRADCPGICDAYRDAFRAARGMGPMRRYPEKLGTPKEHRVATPRRERPKQALRYSGHRWNQPVEAFGQRRTLKEWAKSAGMSYNMLYNRLYRGATLEEALSTEPRRICVPEYIEVDGVRHTVREWAGILGVSVKCIYSRIENGYTPEQAVTIPRMINGRDGHDHVR